ncbi:MAG: YrhA family protein [Alphaproteobacteria bacterium]|nr:YrhA family protein [Alphaproteobacteria bacterium SS10]
MSELSHHRDDDPTIPQLLERIAQFAVVQPPAADDEVAAANQALDGIGKFALPEDFAMFLGLANGLNWNGIQLFGTEDVPRPHRNYTVPSLVTANQTPGRGVDGPNQLVIGTTGEETLVIERQPDGSFVYQECERLDGELYRSAATLRRMLTRMIKERMG